jgi:acyl-CoA reductase-like NAD-dependent aldehyde dehydrogenase/predicted metal-dependent phosphoesterase TrpH
VAGVIDLHAHTTFSDGTFTPEELVGLARERGLTTLAVTDHDSTEGVPRAFAAAERTGLEIVPGVEFSTVRDGHGIHVLAYWIDLGDQRFQDELRRLRDDRFIRGERMVRKLQELGHPISFDRVREIAQGKNIIRPHIAQALVEAGVVPTIEDAFSPELIRDGGRAYVEKHALDPIGALRLIKEAGGVVVVAHPGLFREGLGVPDAVIEEMATAGLDGIEAAHPDHPPEAEGRYRDMARRLGLVVTGSSDCHGTRYDPVRLGSVTTDPDQFARLKAKKKDSAVVQAPERRSDVIESRNPATGAVIGTVAITAPEDVDRVAREVRRIQRGWALVPLPERLRVFRRATEVLVRRREELADLISREGGKPVVEAAINDVGNATLTVDWVARAGLKYLSPERLADMPLLKHKTHWTVYRPLGVVGIISPWNFPLAIPIGEVSQALAAGNGVLLKPSEHTPLTADAIASVFADAGLPDGLLRVVHGYGQTGAGLCRAEAVRKVFFTGSVPTGRMVMELAAKHGKPVMLDLGGKDPAIVCADADLDRTVDGVLWCSLLNSGQACAGIERVYVDRRVAGRFVSALVDRARTLRLGDPSDPGTQIGPMNNDLQYEKVATQIEDAVKRGAMLECGGPVEIPGFAGRFIAPTILTGVDHTMPVMIDETFGPVIGVMPFDTEEQAVRLANDSRYGLGASVWSRDLSRARLLADRIDAGMVWINDHTYSHGYGEGPWGGVKDSGVGVTHSKHGFYEMVEKRLVSEDPGWFRDGWWFPYGDRLRRGFEAVVEAFLSEGGRFRTAWDRRRDIIPYLGDLRVRRDGRGRRA